MVAVEADPNNVPGDDLAVLPKRLETAVTVLDASRASLAAAAVEPPGKQPEQEAALPPLLAELIAPDTAQLSPASIKPTWMRSRPSSPTGARPPTWTRSSSSPAFAKTS